MLRGVTLLILAGLFVSAAGHAETPTKHQKQPSHRASTAKAAYVPRKQTTSSKAAARPKSKPGHRGKATYYSTRNASTARTATGEHFDPNKLTAASRDLPLGSEIVVVNMRNGRRVNVRINDRGPSDHNILLDLSPAAASQIGMLSEGAAQIEFQPVDNSSAK